jgi:hypothetical protein
LQRLYPLPMHSRGRACHTGGGPPEEGSGFGVHGPAEGSGFGVQGTGGKTEGDGGPLGSSGSQQSPGAEGE